MRHAIIGIENPDRWPIFHDCPDMIPEVHDQSTPPIFLGQACLSLPGDFAPSGSRYFLNCFGFDHGMKRPCRRKA